MLLGIGETVEFSSCPDRSYSGFLSSSCVVGARAVWRLSKLAPDVECCKMVTTSCAETRRTRNFVKMKETHNEAALQRQKSSKWVCTFRHSSRCVSAVVFFVVMFYASKAPFLFFVLFYTFSTPPYYELTTFASFFFSFFLFQLLTSFFASQGWHLKGLHSISLFPFRSIFISMHIVYGSLRLYAGT